MESKCDYFRRRAREERIAAGRSTHPQARYCHLELAGRYLAALRSARLVANENSPYAPMLEKELMPAFSSPRGTFRRANDESIDAR